MRASWVLLARRRVPGGSQFAALVLGIQSALLLQSASRAQEGPLTIDGVSHLRLEPSRATRDHWRLLPGVGPVLARALEAELLGRDEWARSDIDDVPGVGPARLNAWASLLSGAGEH
ncbi:MAG: hypothetical protein MK101_04030 [Phycisphaerales bacterium]|nr:hypothetical protein [Phycisphaerales bacterium]